MVYYFFGRGLFIFEQRSTIVHADILQTLSVFAIISTVLFYTEKNGQNLLYTVILMMTIFLSFRRASFWFYFIVVFFITFIFIKNGSISKKIAIYFFVSLACVIIMIMFWGTEYFNVDYYIQRQLGAFVFFTDKGYSGENIYLGDSNHLVQSIETTKFISSFILNNFWGSGINNSFMESTNYVAGASMGGIHNSFAFIVIRYGTFMLFYVLVLLSVLLKVLIKNRRIFKEHVSLEVLYSYIGLLILLFTILSSWSPTMVTFVFSDTNSIVQFVSLFSLIKIVNYYDQNKNIYINT
ncbi:hypothetical protein A2V49_04570 [candidate division WWE3 bacterium RBG_19FT_COMBO_34_6]|uniref:Uncharacterized protein n=1 Tax=candidate division WWE3 bacterium RBG_19FT_COMBO_34_6 TaxID=1802612 RepID=A0A1F4UM86_UNCKA|nr:MAG: hypothetical protein A2V49_04570 [candidate division WWE3 bacterium RBG_19FT_COMBO_34_6]